MADAAKILLTEGDAPAAPASGQVALYPKTDHKLYMKVAAGTEHEVGAANAFVYIAYASDDAGSDFTMIFDPDLDYYAIKSTATAISSPQASDFSGLWKNVKGAPGLSGGATLPSGTAESDFIVAEPSTFAWIKKTLAEVRTILGLVLTQSSQAIGFTLSGGTTSKTLTVPLDASVSGTNTGDSATPAETTTTIGALINGATAKTSAVDADYLPLMDSEATNLMKKLSWAYVKSILKTYFDGLYNLYVHPSGDGNLHVPATSTTNIGKVLTAGATAGTFTWEGRGVPVVAAGGTADAITATYSPAITLADLTLVAFVATAANQTTTPSFTPNNLTTHTITKKGGSAVAAGDIPAAGSVALICYNLAGTRWELLNPASAFSPASPVEIGSTAPGIVRGYNKEIFRTCTADGALTAAEMAGTVISNYGMTDADCAIPLPTAAAGLASVVILPAVRARYFKLQADTNDKIYLIGVAGSNNGYVGFASGYATGSSFTIFTFKASDGGYDWFVTPLFGTPVAS